MTAHPSSFAPPARTRIALDFPASTTVSRRSRSTRGLGWLGAAFVLGLLVFLPSSPASSTMARLPSSTLSPLFHLGHWTVIAPRSSPHSRQSGGMVYDPLAKEFVLFGGYSNGPLGDTWIFKNNTWTQLALNVTPAARWYFSMVWDAYDGYVLLFGGRNLNSDFNDTWMFNGTAWTQLNLAVAPPPMTSGRIAYDAHDGYVVMYGGYSIMAGAPAYYNTTWTFRAGAWANQTANVHNAPPDPHVVTYAAYDALDRVVLLFGGTSAGNAACTTPGHTWIYTGGKYANISRRVGTAPPLIEGSRMMAYDAGFPGVVLYGGWDGSYCRFSNQTWVFHNLTWTLHKLAYNPGPLWDADFASNGHIVLLFGGNTVPYTGGQSKLTWTLKP